MSANPLHLVEKPAPAEQDFFQQYLEYTSGTEVPTTFNRWSIIVGLSAFLGKSVYVRLGEGKIYPNMYCLLMGTPGTRKSTAIKDMKKFLTKCGYDKFAHSKTSKEQFLADLADGFSSTPSGTNFDIDKALFDAGSGAEGDSSEVFVSPDEFTEFFGNNILDFVSTLGDLWDFEGMYKVRVKNSASSAIHNPYVTLIGATTPGTINETFPHAVIGQGFFSRLLFIHGSPNGRRIAFPKPRDPELTERLSESFKRLRHVASGELTLSDSAVRLVEAIYRDKVHPVEDGRFAYYAGRRQTQLLKLSILHAIARGSREIGPVDVRKANTVLSVAEHYMPKALGEFGRSRSSEVAHKVLSVMDGIYEPITVHELWKYVQQDLDKLPDLMNIVQGLVTAEKLMLVADGIMPVRPVLDQQKSPMYDWAYMTPEELGEG